MSRRSLRPQLNQIRGWVRQGRTDAWIAHQLEVTVQQIQAFKRENEPRARRRRAPAPPSRRSTCAPRTTRDRRRARGRGGPPRRGGGASRRGGRKRAAEEDAPRPTRTTTRTKPDAASARAAPRRPRPRRDARRGPLEGTFDHGEEGYGLWLDPAVAGRPRLRRALGGPPPRRGHDRGGPDRDPPRRRRRRRRRLSSRACGRPAGSASQRGRCDGPSRAAHGIACCCTPAHPTYWDVNLRARRGRDRASRAEELLAEAERLQAPAGCATASSRSQDEAAGARLRRRLRRRRAGSPSALVVMRAATAPTRAATPRRRRGGRASTPTRALTDGVVRASMSATEARDARRRRAPTRAARGMRALRRAERDGEPVGVLRRCSASTGVGQVEQRLHRRGRTAGTGSAARLVARGDRRAARARRRPRDDRRRRRRTGRSALYERLGFETVDGTARVHAQAAGVSVEPAAAGEVASPRAGSARTRRRRRRARPRRTARPGRARRRGRCIQPVPCVVEVGELVGA